jgi:hypothetical protein
MASQLVGAPNTRSGGLEFEYPTRIELVALTEGKKIPEVMSFYSGDPVMIEVWTVTDRLTCLAVSLTRCHGRRWYFSTKPSPCGVE